MGDLMTATRCIVVLAAMIGLSACALSEDMVTLTYQPTLATPIEGAARVPLQVAVSDLRSGDRQRVSVKKNGYGMEMAAIRSDRPVIELFRAAIEQELQARGFTLDKGTMVDVEITRLWNDFKSGFFTGNAVAEVGLNVKVKSPTGQMLFTRAISAEGMEKDIQLASGENAKLALDRGIQTAVAKLLSDREFIAALLGSGKVASSAAPTS
jgi:uncharacterized lipoprotein YajG